MSYAEYKVKVHSDGTEEWLNSNGQLHREDGPARVCSNGAKTWFKNGLLHREDGPAVVHPDEYKAWYKNGKRHREDGPAIVYADGTKCWYQNGLPHRVDGPAIHSFRSKAWFLNGIEYSEQELHKELAKRSDPCDGKFVEIDGKKYQLSLID